MKQKATYEQIKCVVVMLSSDIVRTSNPEDRHLIADAGNWGEFSEGSF